MSQRKKSLRSALLLAAGLASGSLAACSPVAPPAPPSGGGGGSAGGGRPSGADGSAGAGTVADVPDASLSGMADAVAPGAPDGSIDASQSADASQAAVSGFAPCIVCHGPEGSGTVLGPDIQHPVVDYSTWVVRNGRTNPLFKEPMPKFPIDQLSAMQLEGILAFLASRPKPTTGPELFKDYCQNCHGADAKGGVTTRDISAEPVAAFISNPRSGHHPGEFENRMEYMPRWTAAELSDAELRLIFAHVDGL